MSGHSKWANIKHKKGKADALRGKITTKISREITIAVRMGGADPTGNMKLKLALSKAKANKEASQPVAEEKATAQQIKLIKEQLEKENPEDQKNIMEYILSTYGVSSLEEMTVPQASDCLSRFE